MWPVVYQQEFLFKISLSQELSLAGTGQTIPVKKTCCEQINIARKKTTTSLKITLSTLKNHIAITGLSHILPINQPCSKTNK